MISEDAISSHRSGAVGNTNITCSSVEFISQLLIRFTSGLLQESNFLITGVRHPKISLLIRKNRFEEVENQTVMNSKLKECRNEATSTKTSTKEQFLLQ
jgi:hypothetical protein